MGDESGSAPVPDPRTAAALSERVAVIETQQKALKEDTGVIRSSLHGINNEMQRFVQVEQKCADQLAQILAAIKDLPSISQVVMTFTEMRPELRAVLDDRQRREGMAAFGRRFAMIVGATAALVAAVGGIAAGLIWLAKHVVLP